jgi:hypothetical protein
MINGHLLVPVKALQLRCAIRDFTLQMLHVRLGVWFLETVFFRVM